MVGRIMAIDYGTKRIGVAATDPLRIIASGLATVPNQEIFEFLKDYLSRETVDIIVIGEPQRSDGSISPIQHNIDNFIKQLKKLYPLIEVTTFNEQFSSQRASEIIRMSGAKRKKRQNKALVDTVSASVILQDYMEENFWS
jgi:putative holliday junction resolvase